MKIDVNKILLDGEILQEHIDISALDLDTQWIKFRKPVRVRAEVSKITNAVTVNLNLSTVMYTICSRCLQEFAIPVEKSMKLNYQAEKLERYIDLDPDIRDEIILDYPIKPLCQASCLGFCPECGKNRRS